MNGNDPGMDAAYLEAAASRRAQQEMEAKVAPALDRIATALERIADSREAPGSPVPFAEGQSMRRFKYDNLTAAAPQAVRSDFLITGVRVETKWGHDHVTVWNRGACSGTLIVKEGDGMQVADLLTMDGNLWRGAPEQESTR